VPTAQFSFGYYLAAMGSSNLAMGLHKVLFPWLVVGVLMESPSQLGLAQMAVLLPNLLFILPGGVVSDRRHRGTWLAFLYFMYLVPLAVLMVSVITGELTFNLLLLFGIAFGTISAFVQPARESMLGFAAPDLIHQTVAKVQMVHFIAQAVGFWIAGQLDIVSLPQLLAFQMAILVVSSVLIKRSHPVPKGDAAPVKDSKTVKHSWQELREGLQLFRDDKGLLHLLIIVFATGFLAFGVYLVGMPLIARELYDGGAGLYATMQIVFSLGIVSANFGVMKRSKMFNRPGRLMVVSFLLRGSMVGVIAAVPSIWLLFPLIYIWGACSGLSMTLGRTILHSQVPLSLRSRAASVYQLCLFGGAPLGAWVCGVTVESVGLINAFLAVSAVTFTVAVLTVLFSPLWHIRANRAKT
jgi:MFS family permease